MEFPQRNWDRSAADRAAEEGGGLFERLLRARGIDAAAQERFCSPSLTQLQHPAAMHGMREAARTICAALRAGKLIAIYGDYDVDGVMATAILFHMLRAIEPAARLRTYIPHRIEEGYGLNAEAIRRLHGEGVGCIVTVDCGLAAPDEVALARGLGMDIVVSDHHEPRGDGAIPDANAVVHPRLAPSEQRFGDLCGAGVAWKLAWMTASEWSGIEGGGRPADDKRPPLPAALRARLFSLLPLAAIGTVADVVPLRDENRVIVAVGLRGLRETGIAGVDALLDEVRLAAPASSTDIAFRFAPLINACGRMGHAEDAAEAFTTADRRRARELAALFADLNRKRREQDARIFDEAMAMVSKAELFKDRAPRGIVLADLREEGGWNLGVVGIVCSKLVERFACPTILLTRNQGIFKGSGRSVEGVELHQVLESCSAHLLGFGGHAMAAGLKLEEHAIDAFAADFDTACDALLPPPTEQRLRLAVDACCRLPELDFDTVKRIESLAPFGRDNPAPALLIESVEVTRVDRLGAKGEHAAIRVSHGQRTGAAKFLRCMWWRSGERSESISKGMRLDVVVQPKLNSFRGQAEVEAEIVDLQVAAATEVAR